MKSITNFLTESMPYKEQSRHNELLTKLRIIYDVKKFKYPQTSVAMKYSMHRNTVRNILEAFNKRIDPITQDELLKGNLNQIELEEKMSPIKNSSRKPHSNKRCANKKQEELIISYFKEKGFKVGWKRMYQIIQRQRMHLGTEDDEHEKNNLILKDLTCPQLKGIYKRNNFTVKKVRAYNGTSTPLYDYDALACFERLHYDTKSILDKKALPEAIYKKFKNTKNIPIIEWNIIDAKTRFRFIAYSHNRSAEFGLHFLLFVLQYIRSLEVPIEQNIKIGVDNGSEFMFGSIRKKAQWNKLLNILNAEIEPYEPGHDVRKNLIERSHRTDYEEFFVPRGQFINGKKSFLKEAYGYAVYYNGIRSHSGKGMNSMTPIEKMKKCGIYNAEKYLEFPTMILEKWIDEIKKSTEIIRVLSHLNDHKERYKTCNFDQKFLANLRANFNNFFKSAQNVLTYYQQDKTCT